MNHPNFLTAALLLVPVAAGTGLFVVLNTVENATGLFAWDRAITRSFLIKFTRQFGTGG